MEVPAAETAELIARARAGGARVVLNLAPAAALPDGNLAPEQGVCRRVSA